MRRTLSRLVRFIQVRFHWCAVFGFGIAFSRGYTLATDDWVWLVRMAAWKVYLGPLMITGEFPYYAIKGKPPMYCKPNRGITVSGYPAVTVDNHTAKASDGGKA